MVFPLIVKVIMLPKIAVSTARYFQFTDVVFKKKKVIRNFAKKLQFNKAVAEADELFKLRKYGT